MWGLVNVSCPSTFQVHRTNIISVKSVYNYSCFFWFLQNPLIYYEYESVKGLALELSFHKLYKGFREVFRKVRREERGLNIYIPLMLAWTVSPCISFAEQVEVEGEDWD